MLGLWPTTSTFSWRARTRAEGVGTREGGVGGEGVGDEDRGLVAGLGADERAVCRLRLSGLETMRSN